jgi:hypothetical protein
MATKVETKLNKIERELITVKLHLEALLELSEGNLTRALRNDSKKGSKTRKTKSNQELYSCSCPAPKCKAGKKWRKGGIKKDGTKWGLTAHKDNVLAQFNAGRLEVKPVFKKLKA